MVSFFAVGMTFFAVPPLLEILRTDFRLSNLAIGALMGAIAAPAIGLAIPFGIAVDRWSGRRSGLTGLGLMLVGAIAFAAAPSYVVLVLGRLVFGVGALIMNLLLARLLAVAFAGRELALAMALFTGVYPASMILLFSLHPRLVQTFGWRGEMAVLAGLVSVALPLHAWAVPRQPATRRSDRTPLTPLPWPLFALGATWMLYFAAFAAVPTFAPEWAGGGSRGLLVTSVITWVALVATPLIGTLIDRTGHAPRWCVAFTTLLAATLAGMALGLLPKAAAMALLGVVAGGLPPAVYSLPGRLVGADRLGFAFGFITALSNLGTVAGPSLAGAVRDATASWGTLWGVLALVAAASVVTAALLPALPPAGGELTRRP